MKVIKENINENNYVSKGKDDDEVVVHNDFNDISYELK